MFKKVIPLLLIPALLFSAEIVKKFTFSAPFVSNSVAYMEGCRTSVVPFAPCLATKSVTLVLPYGEEAVAFDVEYGNPIELEKACYLRPFRPGGIITNPPPAGYYTRSSEVYSEDAYYPAEVKSASFVTHYRYGLPMFIATISPVQYNPVTGKLRYFNTINVKVQTAKKSGEVPVYKFNSFIKSLFEAEVDNPEVLEKLPFTPRDGDDYDYLIVTTEKLKNDWTDFVAFNNRRCLATKLVTIEYVNSNMTGTDSPDKLKKYIKQEYTTHGITFVMLGGDDNFNTNNTPMADAITHRSYSASFKDYGTNPLSDKDVAADMFYETLDGQELEDFGWEVYAARFPADNATELKNIIDKTIKYSEQPVVAALSKSVLAGEKLWANINGGTVYGDESMDLLIGTSNKYFTTTGFSTWFTHTKLYERTGTWSATTMVSNMNSGVHFVNHLGHSNNTMIMKMYNSNVTGLTNTAYFIGYTEGCYCGCWDNRKIADQATINSGHFDATTGDCIAETFSVGAKGGAVAFISNTRYGLGDDGHASADALDGSCIRFQRYFHDGLFGKKMHHIAIMHAYSKSINKDAIVITDVNTKPYYGQMAYVCYEVNILGDPALSVWSAAPQTLSPTITSANFASDKFQWNSGLPYTGVALCKSDGTIFSSTLSGLDGNCLINDAAYKSFIAASPATVKLRVKAHNYLPLEKDIALSSSILNNNIGKYQMSATFNNYKRAISLNYRLEQESRVNVSLYNAKGMLVKTLLNEHQKAGIKEINVKVGAVANGVYYYKVMINNSQLGDKIVINN